MRASVTGLIGLVCAAALGSSDAQAHPHVFVEANLEIIRDGSGAVTELRHVWRFDELFSSTVLLDFDTNADGQLQPSELDVVSEVVTTTIGESDFFTEVRLDGQSVPFVGPEKILVDYADGQVLMFFAATFAAPIAIGSDKFRVSVSDPSYYVAMDFASEAAIQVSGDGAACNVGIARPDFDKLYAQNQTTLTEQFFADPQNASLGDEWMTWIDLTCE